MDSSQSPAPIDPHALLTEVHEDARLPIHSGLPIEAEAARLHRQTKIVATLGPATSSEDSIRELMVSGVNVFRLNFSHGTHEEHEARVKLIKKISEDLSCPVGIVQDLCGPKLRIGVFPEGEGTLKEDQTVSLRYGKECSADAKSFTIATEVFNPAEVLQPGERVFLADGKVELSVTGVDGGEVRATVVRPGKLRSKVGIAAPDSDIQLPAVTEKDIRDLGWSQKHHPDYVALSFVRDASDVRRLKAEMAKLGIKIPIIAKIECQAALDNLEEILKEVDGVMVARGDLGVDIPPEKVPAAQRKIIEAAHRHGKMVIVATQMLLSMTESAQATRSEINDCERAAGDGADALMLSEETAIGKFPGEAVRMMARAAKEGEQYFDFKKHEVRVTGENRFECSDLEVMALSASEASMSSRIQGLVLCCEDPSAALLVAKHRPHVPVFAYSRSITVRSGMSLTWGIHPFKLPEIPSDQSLAETAFRDAAQKFFMANPKADEFGALVGVVSEQSTGEQLMSLELRRISKNKLAH